VGILVRAFAVGICVNITGVPRREPGANHKSKRTRIMTSNIVPSSTALSIVEQDGTLLVDSRLIADRLGIQHESFIKTIRKHRERVEQRFGNLRFNIGTVTNSVGAVNETTFVLLTQEQVDYLTSVSRHKGDRPKGRLTESVVTNELKREVGGQREVLTPAGNIDLLTSTEVIEVKRIDSWKAAIGQVLVYSLYYPSHKKRIHLFGDCHSDSLLLIEKHCKPLHIKMTHYVAT